MMILIFLINHVLAQDYTYEKYVEFISDEFYKIKTAQISKNEQYLAYGNVAELIIYDLNEKKQIYSKTLDSQINVCRFSNDQKFLYVGSDKGSLYGFDVPDFNQKFKKDTRNPYLKNFIESNELIITISSYPTDKWCRFRKRENLIEAREADYPITMSSTIGMDFNNQNRLVAFGSLNKIDFYDVDTGGIIHALTFTPQGHGDDAIKKIQYVDNNKILSLSHNGILRYSLVDDGRQLTLTRDDQHIFNFDLVDQEQIIIICKNYFKILDKDFNLIKQFNHTQNNDFMYPVIHSVTDQLKSLNYVLIVGSQQLTVMKKIAISPP